MFHVYYKLTGTERWTGEEAAETIGPTVDYLDGPEPQKTLSRPRRTLHPNPPSAVPVPTVGRH